MNTIYTLVGGFSILFGIVIMFISKMITANLELVHGVGINTIESYHFSYYAVACFVVGGIFIILNILNIYKK